MLFLVLGVWWVWLSGRVCFWDPASCGHGIFQLECVSWYWELALRDGDMLERKGAEGIHRREKSCLWHLDLFSTIIMGTKWQERPLLVVWYRFGMRLIGCIWRRGRKWRSEGCLPNFLGYPLPWAAWTEASQWMPLGIVSFFPGQYGQKDSMKSLWKLAAKKKGLVGERDCTYSMKKIIYFL